MQAKMCLKAIYLIQALHLVMKKIQAPEGEEIPVKSLSSS